MSGATSAADAAGAPAPGPVIELRDVCKAYRSKGMRKVLFEGLTFDFPKGRNVAIMGHNGAGKSTLMRLIAGTEQPDSGRITRLSRVSWPLAFTGGFNGSMTGLENVRFVSRLYGQDTERVLDYVQSFAELGPSLNMPIRSYSSGMKARLAFGLSMAVEFDVYLIDEITAVGDGAFRRKSKQVFQEKLVESQIIMVSHSSGTIRELCDCGLLVTRRGITFYDDVEPLLEAYAAAMSTAK